MMINLPFDGPEPKPYLAVASFDGGGYRGLASLYLEEELEKVLGVRLGEKVTRMAGTSIGSLNALTAAYPNEDGKPKWSAAEMIPKFEDAMLKIFSRTWGQYVSTGGGLWGPQYNRSELDAISYDYLKEMPLNNTLVPVSIPAVDFMHETTTIFRSSTAPGSLRMLDVLKASTAAPSYFESYTFEYEGILRTFVDGGVVANNPTQIAYRDLLTEDRPTLDSKVVVISFGTGVFIPNNPVVKKGWGALQWAPEIIGTFTNSNADLTHQGMTQLIPNEPGSGANYSYARLQIRLDKDHDNISNPTEANYAYIRDKVNEFLEKNPDLLRNIAKELGEHA